MSWSPDDSMLVICGRDSNSNAIIYSVEVSTLHTVDNVSGKG